MKRINLSTWALMQHQIVRYLMVILLLGGGYAFWNLGQAEDPSFTFRTMSVRVNWAGASAREMDQEIASRLEKKLRETPNVDLVEGYSEPGKTVLLVNLRDDISQPGGRRVLSSSQTRGRYGSNLAARHSRAVFR